MDVNARIKSNTLLNTAARPLNLKSIMPAGLMVKSHDVVNGPFFEWFIFVAKGIVGCGLIVMFFGAGCTHKPALLQSQGSSHKLDMPRVSLIG